MDLEYQPEPGESGITTGMSSAASQEHLSEATAPPPVLDDVSTRHLPFRYYSNEHHWARLRTWELAKRAASVIIVIGLLAAVVAVIIRATGFVPPSPAVVVIG